MPRLDLKAMATGAAALLLSGGLMVGSVSAQSEQQGEQPPSKQGPQPATDVSEKELDKFAEAVVELQKIEKDYSQKMGQVEEKKEAQQIQTQMQEEMRQAIEEKGLSIQRYSQIGKALKGDKEMSQKVQEKIESHGSS